MRLSYLVAETFPPSVGAAPRARPARALVLIAGLALALLTPLLFAELITGGLSQLHLSTRGVIGFISFMFVGAFFNIPIYRIERADWVVLDPLAVFGLGGLAPALQRQRRETIIAVNVGGCFAPLGLAAYEIYRISPLSGDALIACAIVIVTSILLCFSVSRVIEDLGVTMPVLLPAATAAILAVAFAPEHAAPVAFIAGVLGPLVGADLLHLPAIARTQVGVASIGGAGTFDGIVLSGLIAAYLS